MARTILAIDPGKQAQILRAVKLLVSDRALDTATRTEAARLVRMHELGGARSPTHGCAAAEAERRTEAAAHDYSGPFCTMIRCMSRKFRLIRSRCKPILRDAESSRRCIGLLRVSTPRLYTSRSPVSDRPTRS